MKHISCGYGFTVFVAKSDDETKVYGTGINMDSQLGRVSDPGKKGEETDVSI